MIAPHGGRLVTRSPFGALRDALRSEAARLPAIALSPKEAADVQLIATGAYSPLDGFMDAATYHSVIEHLRLPDELPWALPITLPVPEDLARRLQPGDQVSLRAPGLLAVLEVTDVFTRDQETEARHVFETADCRHPGVARLLAESPWVAGGPLWLVERPPAAFPDHTLDPAQTRRFIERADWQTVTAFQTRNPIHRAHEYLHKCALEVTDGLLLHPLVGATVDDDLPAALRMRCYEAILDAYYPKDRVLLAAFPAAMRYAGPREAIFHALVRKNYGCTHIIIGRDHAGVGGFYGPYDAHRIFRRFGPQELGITPLFFEDAFFCRRCQGMATRKTCPHAGRHRVSLSGTMLRSMLEAGQSPPPEVTRPEVAALLMQAFVERAEPTAPPVLQEGETG